MKLLKIGIFSPQVYRSAPKFSFRSKTADPDVIFNERFFNTYP